MSNLGEYFRARKEAQEREHEYPHEVIAWIDSTKDDPKKSDAVQYQQMLDTLYAIATPDKTKRPWQDKWILWRAEDKRAGKVGYRLLFRQSDHAALFKLAWGGR